MKREELESMNPIMVQAYYDECSKDSMIGTQEYPAYLCGCTSGIDNSGFFAYYDIDEAKHYPGIITPKYLERKYGKCKINLLIGDTLKIGINMPKDGDVEYDGDVVKVRIDF